MLKIITGEKFLLKRQRNLDFMLNNGKKIFRLCSRYSSKLIRSCKSIFKSMQLINKQKKLWHVSNAFIIPKGRDLRKD